MKSLQTYVSSKQSDRIKYVKDLELVVTSGSQIYSMMLREQHVPLKVYHCLLAHINYNMDLMLHKFLFMLSTYEFMNFHFNFIGRDHVQRTLSSKEAGVY